MSDDRNPAGAGDRHDDEPPSLDEIARLDAALDRLIADRRPASHDLSPVEAREQMLAAQLRLAREGVEAPTPAFLHALEQQVGRAVDRERRGHRRAGLSRGRFLRAAAALAGGAGLGVAAVEVPAVAREAQAPHELVEGANGRWYAIAAVGDVAPGGAKPFSAGGLLGFLLNDGGRLHAVSAICTHMGCRLKPSAPGQSPAELHCLCHGSRFNRRGEVVQGLAPTPLPEIAVRVENGQVYALGTREAV